MISGYGFHACREGGSSFYAGPALRECARSSGDGMTPPGLRVSGRLGALIPQNGRQVVNVRIPSPDAAPEWRARQMCRSCLYEQRHECNESGERRIRSKAGTVPMVAYPTLR